MMESPRFFKIVLPSAIHQKKLKIPEKFVKKYGSKLSAVAILTVPTGHESRVGLEKAGKTLWFCDGWQQFMEHNSIGCFYFLVFVYKANSSFDVHIFDLSATEIEYPIANSICCSPEEHNNGNQCQLFDEDEIKDDDSVEILGSSGFVGSSSKRRPGHDKKGKGAALGESSIPTRQYLTRSKRNEIENLNELCGRRPSTSKKSKREMPSCHASLLGKSKKGNQPVTKDVENLQALNDSELNVKIEKVDVEVQHPTKRAKISQMASQRTVYHRKESLVKHEWPEEMPRPKTCSIRSSRRRPKKNQTSEMAINAARMFKPSNPFQMVILHPSHVKKHGTVYFPTEFAKKLLHLFGISAFVKLQVSDGRHWPVRYIHGKRLGNGHGAILSKGWTAFVKENSLVEGDICVFELINVMDIVLNVSIFRAVAYAGKHINPLE